MVTAAMKLKDTFSWIFKFSLHWSIGYVLESKKYFNIKKQKKVLKTIIVTPNLPWED